MFDSSDDNAAALTKAFMEAEPAMRDQIAGFLSAPEDVDDMLYEAYTKAYDAMQSKPIPFPKRYLIRMARNLGSKYAKKQADSLIDIYEPAVIGDLNVNHHSTEDELLHQEAFAQLDHAINQLPDQCQRVVLLRCKKQLSYKEIASSLGISIKSVEKHLTLAVKRCAEMLRPKDAEKTNDGAAPTKEQGINK